MKSTKIAIAVPYVVDQNEPSKPSSTLYDIPIDEEEQIKVLHSIFDEYFSFEEDKPKLVVRSDDTYGDLVVADEYGTWFVFLTYVN